MWKIFIGGALVLTLTTAGAVPALAQDSSITKDRLLASMYLMRARAKMWKDNILSPDPTDLVEIPVRLISTVYVDDILLDRDMSLQTLTGLISYLDEKIAALTND